VTGARPVRSLAGSLALLAVATACARAPVITRTPAPDLVVVVPGPDGKVGAVTVTHGSEQRTLDSAYAAARISATGRLEVGRITEQEIREVFGAALDAQPIRPVSFTLFFIFGTDTLTPESALFLARVSGEVGRRPAAEVIVIGHTDRVGSDQQNDVLSLQRAERIRQELIRLGIATDLIETVGRGEREPLVPTDDEVPEPRNRRVEITVR
jgi:outer membrane protein OmpA-like peptidoglycan-associated protein